MDKKRAREWFFSQGRVARSDMSPTDKYDIYELPYTGQVICEVTVASGLGGDTAVIGAVPDLHLNLSDITDASDPEVSYTETCRIWCRGGDSLPNAIPALQAAELCDQAVILGDTLDYISHGSLELAKKHIFDRIPEVICVIGGHDITKQMQTGKPNLLTIEERLALLREVWTHDLHYYSRSVCDKVICVGLDNGQGRYFACQAEKLKADIERARAERKIILIFQHENVSTRNENDRSVKAIHMHDYKPTCNFYDAERLIARPSDKNPDSLAVYRLITENADVIKGIFCGHQHNIFYTEIAATTPSGEKAIIPQYTLTANPYFKNGTVCIINVK